MLAVTLLLDRDLGLGGGISRQPRVWRRRATRGLWEGWAVPPPRRSAAPGVIARRALEHRAG